MERLRHDPNLNLCPDYTSDAFAETRAQLTNENITEEQSIQILKNIWETSNNAAKAQWQTQQEEDRQRHEHLQCLKDEEQENRERVQLEEEEAARKEERKRNKFKYTPIPERDVPTETPIIPASYAIRKLDKGEFVEIWYFTNAGLDDAESKATIDDDAMVMSRLPDGSTTWISAAAARNARSVVEDQDLSFEDFCQACPRFIDAIQAAGWPTDRVKMMALFWRNLQVHEYRSSRDPLAQKALLVYQAEQRKRWHIAVKSASGAYDLSRINETLLERTKNRVYWEDRERKDNERDYKVSKNFRNMITID